MHDMQAFPLSHDHKPMNPGERARIAAAGGCVTNGRVDGNLNLSRSLGDLFYKADAFIPPEKQRITAFPDVRSAGKLLLLLFLSLLRFLLLLWLLKMLLFLLLGRTFREQERGAVGAVAGLGG